MNPYSEFPDRVNVCIDIIDTLSGEKDYTGNVTLTLQKDDFAITLFRNMMKITQTTILILNQL